MSADSALEDFATVDFAADFSPAVGSAAGVVLEYMQVIQTAKTHIERIIENLRMIRIIYPFVAAN